MEAEPQPLSAADVEELFNTGGLIGAIVSSRGAAESILLPHCVALHNSGQIDLLSLPNGQDFEALAAWDFFSVQHFLNDAIPSLKAPVDRVSNVA